MSVLSIDVHMLLMSVVEFSVPRTPKRLSWSSHVNLVQQLFFSVSQISDLDVPTIPSTPPPFSLHNLPCRLFISTSYIHPTSPTCCIFVPHSCSALLSSHIPILRVTQILVRSLLHSSHPVDFELKAFTFRPLISLGLFYSSPSWHAEYALDFSAHVSYITAAWLLSVCTRRLVGCCLLFPFPLCSVECQCVCTRRFSDASTSLYEFLLVSASVCMSACVCGWFYQLLQMAPVSHPSFHWNEEPSEE